MVIMIYNGDNMIGWLLQILVLFKLNYIVTSDLRKWNILEDAMMNQMTTQVLNIDFNIIQFSQCFLETLVSPLESAQYETYVA